MMQGLHDALTREGYVRSRERAEHSNPDQSVRATRTSNANHAAAHAFLARNGKKKGVVTTASGLRV